MQLTLCWYREKDIWVGEQTEWSCTNNSRWIWVRSICAFLALFLFLLLFWFEIVSYKKNKDRNLWSVVIAFCFGQRPFFLINSLGISSCHLLWCYVICWVVGTSLVAQAVEFTWNAGNPDSVPGWGRSPGEGNRNPLQHSWLENTIDGEAWQATVHGITRAGHSLATKPPLSN